MSGSRLGGSLSGTGSGGDANPRDLVEPTEILDLNIPDATPRQPRDELPEPTELFILDDPRVGGNTSSSSGSNTTTTAGSNTTAAPPAGAQPPPPPPSAQPAWVSAKKVVLPGLQAGPLGHFVRVPAAGGVSTTPTPVAPGGSHSFVSPVAPGGQAGIIFTSSAGSTSSANAGPSASPDAGGPMNNSTTTTNPPQTSGSSSSSSSSSSSPSSSSDARPAGTDGPDVNLAPNPNATNNPNPNLNPKPVQTKPDLVSKVGFPGPKTPLPGPYKKVEPMSTRVEIDRTGALTGTSATDMAKIRAQLRAAGRPAGELDCRMELMDRRIRGAYGVHRARQTEVRDPEVLAVFTGPEWTFKMPGKPLTSKQRDQTIDHYVKLSRQCPDMLIVPGTIVSRNKEGMIEAEAFVVHNGTLVHRTRKANEGLDVDGYTDAKGKKLTEKAFAGSDSDPAHFATDSTAFEHGGMRFALEICADHSIGSRAKRQLDPTGGPGVDVHIVVSDGASLRWGALVTHPGGVVVHNDAAGGYRDIYEPGNRPVPSPHDPNEKPNPDNREDSGELVAHRPIEVQR